MAVNMACIAHFTAVQVPPNVTEDGEDTMNYLFSTCMFNALVRIILIDGESLNSISIFNPLHTEDSKTMLKIHSSLLAATSGLMHSIILQGRLYALLWWIKEILSQVTVDPSVWTGDVFLMHKKNQAKIE
eukprot:15326657-Ditylum_brightwellii.AAC.1